MVHGFVEDRSGLALLKDKRIVIATADVSGLSMSREEVSVVEDWVSGI